jgi:hypothetical protein
VVPSSTIFLFTRATGASAVAIALANCKNAYWPVEPTLIRVCAYSDKVLLLDFKLAEKRDKSNLPVLIFTAFAKCYSSSKAASLAFLIETSSNKLLPAPDNFITFCNVDCRLCTWAFVSLTLVPNTKSTFTCLLLAMILQTPFSQK